MRVLLVSANREVLPSPAAPLGLLYVAAAARAAGHTVELLDLCFESSPLTAIEDRLARGPFDAIGLGLRNLHDNAYGDSEPILRGYDEVVRTLRQHSPAPIIVGGSAFSLRPHALMDRLAVDHGIVGEGERAFVTLLDDLTTGHRPGRLVGAVETPNAPLAWPRPHQRAPHQLPQALVLDELAEPARDLLDPRYVAFDGTVNVQSKRGCAFQCTYCNYPDLEGRNVRSRAPERFADELLALSRIPGVTHAFVVDSVFNVPKTHARACCEALIARGAPLPWVCYVSPSGLDEDLLQALARAGCVGIEVGADSGNEAVLRRLRKPFGVGQLRKAHAATMRAGIRDCFTFVLGAEGETVDEVHATLELARSIEPDVAVFIVFVEDREERGIGRAGARTAILDLLAREAPRHPGWVVPELGIRFGSKVSRLVKRERLRGPSWLHLAARRPLPA